MTPEEPCWTCVLRYAEYYLDWTDPKDALGCSSEHIMWQSTCKYYVVDEVAQKMNEDAEED